MVEFVKKHKVPLIILAVSVGLYLLYDYLTASSAAASSPDAADTTDAADQAALNDELANLASGSEGYGGSTSSPIATSPAVTGTIPATATPTSTGTAATAAAAGQTGTSVSSSTSTSTYSTSLAPTNTVTTPEQEQAQMIASGGVDNNGAAAQIAALQADNPAALAAEQAYDTSFTEQDPQQAALAYAAGSNPYLEMLNQQATGGGGQSTAEAAIGNPIPAANSYQFPTTEPTDNTSESSGGSSSAASSSPGTSASRPSDIGVVGGMGQALTITPPTGGPAGLLAASTSATRPLTTVTSSSQPIPVSLLTLKTPSPSGTPGFSSGGQNTVTPQPKRPTVVR
jgi:hypothetical protein